MEIEKKLNKHNNMIIKLYDNTDGTIFSKTGERFSYKATNMFLTEMKVNNPNKPNKRERKFVISIREDGVNNDYKMTQMDFTEDELIKLKENIEEMITYKNKKYKSISENNFQELIGKRYIVTFRSIYESLNHIPFGSIMKPKVIEGYCENFATDKIILYDKEYGFNIIPFRSIIQMLEIQEGE